MVRLDATHSGPRRYGVHAGGRPVGAGKGSSVDMYLLALALGRPIHAVATCPATGTPITVDITHEGVERIDPVGASYSSHLRRPAHTHGSAHRADLVA